MAKILDFFDGSQSASVPTIGNIEASALSTYPDDATFEAFNGPGGPGDVYINTTDNVIRYWNATEDEWQSILSAGSVVDASNIGDGSVSNTEFQYLDGVTSDIQPQLDSAIADAASAAAGLGDHVAEMVDAHDASSISVVPTGNLAADDVQEALEELQDDVDDRILYSEKGAPSGVAELDGAGKVPLSQLPSSVMTYEGMWDASTNTPTLADGVGDPGMVYKVSVSGTQDLGSGSISYNAGDYVILNSSLIWEKSDTTDQVTSVNGLQGIVVLDTDDIAEGANLYFTDERAQDSVGNILVDSATIDFTYSDGTPSITADVINDSIDNLKLANMATQTFKGRTTAGLGDPEDLSATQATAILNTFVGDSGSGGTKGLVPAPAAGDAAANKFLKADGTWTAVSGSGANTALSNLASVDLNQNLTTTKASTLQINHQTATFGISMSTANNGAGASGGMTFTTGTATTTRGDIEFSARVIRFNAATGSDFTGNCTPSANITYNFGAAAAAWNAVYCRFVLGRASDFTVASDFNSGFQCQVQSGHSNGGTGTGVLLATSGDQLSGGTGTIGSATYRAGDIIHTANTNAAGVTNLRGGNNAGTGAAGTVNINGGNITNTSNTNNGGAVTITSGGTNATSGTPTTGAVNINSATPTGTNCSSGNINVTPGTPTGTGTRGKFNVNGLMMKLPTGTADPTGVDNGDAYYNTSTDQLRVFNGGTWRGVTLT